MRLYIGDVHEPPAPSHQDPPGTNTWPGSGWALLRAATTRWASPFRKPSRRWRRICRRWGWRH